MFFYQILYTKVMKIIGHRGAAGLAPENTIASIEKAIEHGVDEVELDVRMTQDGVAVLHHDAYLRDPDGGKVDIRLTTYADLLRHKSDLTALDMAIKQIAHRCKVMIELKRGVEPAKVLEMLDYYYGKGWQPGELTIASKSQTLLREVHAKSPHVPLIVIEPWSGVRARMRCNELGTKRLSMRSWWLYTWYLKMTKRAGYKISPYSVNSVKQANKWRPYVYGIITDRPDLFEK